MNKKTLLIVVLITLVVAAGAFYCGIKLGQSKNKNAFGRGDFANLSQEERQARFRDSGQGFIRGNSGNMLNGEILAIDDKSITLKLRDNGSKIVLFSTATQIMKSTTGAATDLKVGNNLVVMGATNEDGSMTAQSIQIRPVAPKEPEQPVK